VSVPWLSTFFYLAMALQPVDAASVFDESPLAEAMQRPSSARFSPWGLSFQAAACLGVLADDAHRGSNLSARVSIPPK
jgi:hypothetical protein